MWASSAAVSKLERTSIRLSMAVWCGMALCCRHLIMGLFRWCRQLEKEVKQAAEESELGDEV